MLTDPVSVLAIGLAQNETDALAQDESLTLSPSDSLTDAQEVDAVVLGLNGSGPLEALRAARAAAPEAAIVVITDASHQADGTVALHAGAEDHLVRDAVLTALLPRAVRYAVAVRRIRRELATIDEDTRLPNLRGFHAIAEHYLRMADRLVQPAVFVFVRLDDHARIVREEGPEEASALAADASAVILDAVRDSDLPARIGPDTICVLLTGDADGAETTVLSRLVEAIAVHDARRDAPRALALSVGTARYEPGSGATLAEILGAAMRGLSAGS